MNKTAINTGLNQDFDAVHTVSAVYMQSYYRTCLDVGAEPAKLLALIPGGSRFLTDESVRLPGQAVLDVLKYTEIHTGNGAVGLMAGKSFRPASLQGIGHAVLVCKSLRHAILLNRRYQPLTQQFGRTNLQIIRSEAHICWHTYYEDPEYCRNITDAVMGSHAQFGRWLTWVNDKEITAIHFRHKKPDYAPLYEELFECPVLFEQELDKMIVDVEAIDMPLPQANEVMCREICADLDVKLAEVMNTSSCRDKTAHHTRALMLKGVPSLKSVARHVGVSERSLRRNLKDENTSFSEILEQTRKDLCEHYLLDSRFALGDIAAKLGYAEQSSFSRAFKKWYGKTPKAYASDMAKIAAAFNHMAP